MTKKTGNESFPHHVQLGGAAFEPGAARGHTITTEALFYRICTSALCLSKPKVVVRRDVEGTSRGPDEGKSIVEVVGLTVKEIDGSPRDTSDRGRKTVIDTHLHPPSVEGIEI